MHIEGGALKSRVLLSRDMKPENVVLHSEGHCKIIDFGAAQVRVCQGIAGSIIPFYA